MHPLRKAIFFSLRSILVPSLMLSSAWGKVTQQDWATIETPDEWIPGTPVVVKVTPKSGIPAGMKVASELHWHKVDAWGGTLSWVPLKPAKPGEKLVFRHSPKQKNGMAKINAITYLTPGGFKEKVKIAHAEIPLSAKASPSSGTNSANANGTQNGSARKDTDWCTVDYPKEWSPNTPLVISVTPKKGIGAGQLVSADLHWMKVDGYGGFLSWTQPKKVASATSLAFTHKPVVKDGMHRINAFIFLSPDGNFNNRLKELHCEILLGKPAEPDYPLPPKDISWKKSALWIENDGQPVAPGETLSVKVHYILDPSETWGPKQTKIMIQPLGPWIDNPDGVVNKSRQHINIPGIGTQYREVKPGKGFVEFSWPVRNTYRYNSLFFLVKFISPNGKGWPWDWRGGYVELLPSYEKTFLLESASIGGLFPYGQTPVLNLKWGSEPAAKPYNAKLTVRDVDGKTVWSKHFSVNPGTKSQPLKLDGFQERGTFSATLDVPDVGSEYTFFGTIPAWKRIPSKRTPFGCTDVTTPEYSQLAASLGFSYVRHFTGWKGLQPAPDCYTFDALDRTIRANSDAGLAPWLSLQAPPHWALPAGIFSAGFEPSPFDLKAWTNIVSAIAKRYKGSLWGFEWLNEIVPGKLCQDPVAAYRDICRTGTKAAKAVDPALKIQLAGGLWPHNYRVDLLNAGVADSIDFLPVHYSDYAGIREAQRDLEVRDIRHVSVIDNETANGISVWKMDARQTLSSSLSQCLHVMTRWPDERCAGADLVVYFGGAPQAAGNWTYLLDRHTPRPVAVTLAVVQSKLAYAKPVGKFFLEGCPAHLFKTPAGKAILFVKSADQNHAASLHLPLAKKATHALVTDHQGRTSSAADGLVTVPFMPVIVENLDLDALSAYCVASIGANPIPVAKPQCISQLSNDGTVRIPVRIRNPYETTRKITLTPARPGWCSAVSPIQKTLAPNAESAVELLFSVSSGKKPSPVTSTALTVAVEGVPTVELPYDIYMVDNSSIGNLLKNGSMEAGTDGKSPASWSGTAVRAPAPDDPQNHVLRLKGTGNYVHANQNLTIPIPGQTYLYSAWVWSGKMEAGSNIGQNFTDKPTKTWMMPHVFSTGGNGTTYWRLLTKKVNSTPDTTAFSFTPVGKGSMNGGFALYDNVMVTLYKGSDFVAFAPHGLKTSADGDQIPLLCDNQITASNGYRWTPDNLAGKAKFSWDESGLLFQCSVKDDTLVTKPVTSDAGLETLAGDAIALCIFPRMGLDGPTNDQLRWYISKASPGGGSGTCTVFRPKAYSLGAKNGQLAKDSSTYAVSIAREGTTTTYSLKIPWSEIPGFTPNVGASFGCNIQLHDADSSIGHGVMTWGAGLRDTASDCALVTLLP